MYRINEFVPSPNHDRGRFGLRVVAIVDHRVQGSHASAVAWFQQTRSQVSAHFIVREDGWITQTVDLADTAWGNGPILRPDPSIAWLRGLSDANPITVSIEHAGWYYTAPTAAQIAASAWLHTYIRDEVSRRGLGSISLDTQHVVEHRQIDGINKQHCPGFPTSLILAALKSPSPPVTAPPPSVERIVTVSNTFASRRDFTSAPEARVPGWEERTCFADTTIPNGTWIIVYNMSPTKTAQVRLYFYELQQDAMWYHKDHRGATTGTVTGAEAHLGPHESLIYTFTKPYIGRVSVLTSGPCDVTLSEKNDLSVSVAVK